MRALYNELDSYAAQWTRNLIAAGHVAYGVVDERSIAELAAADVAGPGQRHFFSGVAVWSYALRLAGVSDDADIWTGSCPCQPLSAAGRQRGFSDERHLWPVWFGLIRECRPGIVLGEQVASRLGLEWLDLVCADLEGAGYTVRAADTCAAGVGEPHIRQRLYFVAYADSRGLRSGQPDVYEGQSNAARGGDALELADAQCDRRQDDDAAGSATRTTRGPGDLAYASSLGRHERINERCATARHGAGPADGRGSLELGHADGQPAGRHSGAADRAEAPSSGTRPLDRRVGNHPGSSGELVDPWADAEWIACTDGKQRPVGRGVRPLVDGAAPGLVRNRARKLKGYGNAIVARQAASFIAANLDVIGGAL